jgi:hypothetical protein
MELAAVILVALACSAAMSFLAFMIGRCGRKLPIDGMLPRVVHGARFSPDKDRPHPAPEPNTTDLAVRVYVSFDLVFCWTAGRVRGGFGCGRGSW